VIYIPCTPLQFHLHFHLHLLSLSLSLLVQKISLVVEVWNFQSRVHSYFTICFASFLLGKRGTCVYLWDKCWCVFNISFLHFTEVNTEVWSQVIFSYTEVDFRKCICKTEVDFRKPNLTLRKWNYFFSSTEVDFRNVCVKQKSTSGSVWFNRKWKWRVKFL